MISKTFLLTLAMLPAVSAVTYSLEEDGPLVFYSVLISTLFFAFFVLPWMAVGFTALTSATTRGSRAYGRYPRKRY